MVVAVAAAVVGASHHSARVDGMALADADDVAQEVDDDAAA